VFRLDRILELKTLEESFEPPGDFDLDGYLSGRDVYRADAGVTARIRYAPSISRWILERGDAAEGDDGEAIVDRHVADPDWVIRHVLQYGGEAELIAPPELRQSVARSAQRVLEAHTGEGRPRT